MACLLQLEVNTLEVVDLSSDLHRDDILEEVNEVANVEVKKEDSLNSDLDIRH